jgi:hypothetical protein
MKRSPLKRYTALRSRPKRVSPIEGSFLWKEPHAGYCQCGCTRFALRLERHHVVYAQHVKAEHGNEWDMANSMLISNWCHSHHHSGFRRIPLESIPEPALAFGVDLMGEDKAALYFARYYGADMSIRRAA